MATIKKMQVPSPSTFAPARNDKRRDGAARPRMDKREFLKASGAVVAGTLLSKVSRGQAGGSGMERRTNWAGNYTYLAEHLDAPTNVDEVKKEIVVHARVKALGARHSFNSIADSKEEQISLKQFDGMELDEKNRTVTVGAGVSYGQLAPYL